MKLMGTHMPLFVHLTPERNARAVLRSGLHGGRGVFCMPLMPDYYLTRQWLRELKRSGQRTIVAVDFRLPPDEPVLVGHYGRPHQEIGSWKAGLPRDLAFLLEHPCAEIVETLAQILSAYRGREARDMLQELCGHPCTKVRDAARESVPCPTGSADSPWDARAPGSSAEDLHGAQQRPGLTGPGKP
jgi:hypothetical protein